MILYLTKNHPDIFDQAFETSGRLVKKMMGYYDFMAFLQEAMPYYSHVDVLVIDVTAINNTETDFIDALKAFKQLFDANLVLYARGFEKGNSVLKRVIDEASLYNVIVDQDKLKAIEKMTLILQHDFTKNDVAHLLERDGEPVHFVCSNVKIFVAGTTQKAGTTTLSLQLALFASKKGANVYYVAAYEKERFDQIAVFYNLKKKAESHYVYQDCHFVHASVAFEHDEQTFIVIDAGKMEQNLTRLYARGDIKVIVSRSKPEDFIELDESLDTLAFDNVVFTFCQDDKQGKLISQYKKQTVLFKSYQPNYFVVSKEDEVLFKTILKDYFLQHEGGAE